MRICKFISLMSIAVLLLGCAMQSKAFGSKGASKYFVDEQTLQVAEAAAEGDIEKIQTLKDKGANIDGIGKDGVTPLLWALSQGNKKGVEALLSLGADPNHQTEDGDSMMSLASQMTDHDFLRLAVKYKGNPNLTLANGPPRSPLMAAIGPGGLDNVKTLLQAGANINYQDPVTGDTPLMQAGDLNQFDIVYYLLEQGADYKLKNKFGNTIVYDIEMNNIDPKSQGYTWRQKVIEYLRSKNISVNPKIP